MKRQDVSRRYFATDELRLQIDRQGRRSDWLAQQLGVSKGFFSKVVSRQKSISEADARVLTALLSGDFGVLFEFPESAEEALEGMELVAAS